MLTEKIDIVKKKYNTPTFLNTIKNSSNGVLFNDEIWFILCKEEKSKLQTPIYDSKHLFVIFDKNMDFLRYSEFFAFTKNKNEFCRSFFIKKNIMYIGYGFLNKKCYVAKYNIHTLKKQLKWFTT